MTDKFATLDRLRGSQSGSVLYPGDADYDDARRAWNLSVDQRPAAVAVPADVADVQAIVRASIVDGLRVTTQPNGHGADGSLEGVVLVRPSRLDEISLDVDRRVVRVGAGVNWGRVLERLNGSGLVALAGSNPEVSVVGLAINGGHSMFSRRFGLTATSLVAVELVDGGGRVRRVSDASDPELMWALRGGGGLFGVVTAVELALYPAEQLFGGALAFPVERAVDVFTAAVELSKDVPELGVEFSLASFPDVPVLPASLRGQRLAGVSLVHVGDASAGQAYADRIRRVANPVSDTVGVFEIGALAGVAAEPVDPMPLAEFGAAVSRLDDAFVRELVGDFGAAADAGLTRVGIRVLGGAIAERRYAGIAAVGCVEASALLTAQVLLADPGVDSAEALAPLRGLTARHGVHGGVPSLLGHGATLADACDAETLAQLIAVKQRVDPSSVFVGSRALA